jgi:hypothetical protein
MTMDAKTHDHILPWFGLTPDRVDLLTKRY